MSFINILIVTVALGCAGITPHENFMDSLKNAIGRSLDNKPSYLWPHEEDLIDSKTLPNGNIENRYKYLRTCKYIFEIDPKTRTIVAARFEGKESDCVINP